MCQSQYANQAALAGDQDEGKRPNPPYEHNQSMYGCGAKQW